MGVKPFPLLQRELIDVILQMDCLKVHSWHFNYNTEDFLTDSIIKFKSLISELADDRVNTKIVFRLFT